MPLQNTGSISLNDINTEFGRGLNLNAYRGTQYYTSSAGPFTFSSSAIDFNSFYGTRIDSNFDGAARTNFGFTSTIYQPFFYPAVNNEVVYLCSEGVFRDAPGNPAGGGANAYKLNANTDVITSGRLQAPGNQNINIVKTIINSSQNVYNIGRFRTGAAGTSALQGLVLITNSSFGAVSSVHTGTNSQFLSAALYSNNNIIATGTHYFNSLASIACTGMLIYKFDSNLSGYSIGVVGNFPDNAGYFFQGNDIRLFANNGYVIAGYGSPTNQSGNSNLSAELIQVGSNDTVQWTRRVVSNQGPAFRQVVFQGVDYDSQGNIYVAGYYRSQTISETGIIAKYNSSGTVQWIKRVSGYNSWGSVNSVKVKNDNEIYFCGATAYLTPGPIREQGSVFEVDGSGNLQWARSVRRNPTNDFSAKLLGITIENNHLYLAGRAGNFTFGGSIPYLWGVYLKVPTDGTKTGTYTLSDSSIIAYANDTTFSLTNESTIWSEEASNLNFVAGISVPAPTSYTPTVNAAAYSLGRISF